MPLLGRRRFLTGIVLCVIIVCMCWRIYHAFVPRGASPIPYIAASVDGGTIESPNGTEYEIWFNDAGAAHSGNHWTWVSTQNTLFGKAIVAEGYLGPEYAVDQQPIPITWVNDEPVIQFLPDRYGN